MVINALVFPGVILFLLYAFLMPYVFNALSKNAAQFSVYAVNPPALAAPVFEYGGIELIFVPQEEEEVIKKNISEKKAAFLLVFPVDFDAQTANYDVSCGTSAPEIAIYYNSMAIGFSEQYGRLTALLDAWEAGMANKFDVNVTGGGDLVKKEDVTGYFLSILFPLFIIMFIFHGAMAVTIGAVTGEKEKGTFAAVLVAPISTRELAAAKVLALGFQAFLCGISGSLGILLSLPRFIKNVDLGITGLEISLSVYSAADYAVLLLVLFSAAYLIVTIVALVSILARTVREAQMFLVPIFIALLSLSLISLVYSSANSGEGYSCFIPFYGTIQLLSGIFSRSYTALQIILTILTNLCIFILGTEILSRLFRNEKIMFNT
jgi:sodium transport system permease protein